MIMPLESILLDSHNGYIDPKEITAQRIIDLIGEVPDGENVVGTVVRETEARPFWWNDPLRLVEEYYQGRFKLILEKTYLNHENISAHHIHWWALSVDYHAKQNKNTIHDWNSDSSKFLFLTGKPYKTQRIRLLWKLSEAGLLERAKWSLFRSDNIANDMLQKYVPELSDSELTDFLSKYESNPDGTICDDVTVPINSRWVGHTLYDDIVLSLISCYDYEDARNPMILCEKIWKPIYYNQPFILAGPVGTLKRLKNLGYKTFENYLKHPEYDEETDHEKRLDLIVKNVEGFLNDVKLHALDIAIDIRHNSNLLREQMLGERKMLEDMGINFNEFMERTENIK